VIFIVCFVAGVDWAKYFHAIALQYFDDIAAERANMKLAPLWIERFKMDRINNLHKWGVLSKMPKRSRILSPTARGAGTKFTVKNL
jgi:hypothetical protein